MKILHVLQNYEPSKGGTQLLFKRISETLVLEFNDEVTVATTNSLYDPGSKSFKKLPKNSLIEGVKIKRFSFFRSHRRLLKILFKITGRQIPLLQYLLRQPLSIKLKKYIYYSQSDVVCGSSSNYSYMDYACNRLKQKNIKPFVFMGAIHFDDEKDIWLPNEILRNIICSDKYIANTDFEKKCLIQLGVPSNKINVIGCGVHPRFFVTDHKKKQKSREKYGIPNGAFVVGYVGRFSSKKGVETLLKAFSLFADQHSILLMAGAVNDYLKKLLITIEAEYGELKSRIVLLTDFEEEEKPNIYAAMDVFVSASYSESFGIVFLEAWAAGLPVVGTNIGAIRSVIQDGVDGKLFAPHDHIELLHILLSYFHYPETRERHGLAGLDKVNKRYTWHKIAKAYRQTYLEAIEINRQRLCVDL